MFNNNVDLSFKVQHFSNGGTQKPNDGTNFVVIKLGHTF
ncbi:MAG: acyloxyacyl hydrolase [Rhodoferax sp.]